MNTKLILAIPCFFIAFLAYNMEEVSKTLILTPHSSPTTVIKQNTGAQVIGNNHEKINVLLQNLTALYKNKKKDETKWNNAGREFLTFIASCKPESDINIAPETINTLLSLDKFLPAALKKEPLYEDYIRVIVTLHFLINRNEVNYDSEDLTRKQIKSLYATLTQSQKTNVKSSTLGLANEYSDSEEDLKNQETVEQASSHSRTIVRRSQVSKISVDTHTTKLQQQLEEQKTLLTNTEKKLTEQRKALEDLQEAHQKQLHSVEQTNRALDLDCKIREHLHGKQTTIIDYLVELRNQITTNLRKTQSTIQSLKAEHEKETNSQARICLFDQLQKEMTIEQQLASDLKSVLDTIDYTQKKMNSETLSWRDLGRQLGVFQ